MPVISLTRIKVVPRQVMSLLWAISWRSTKQTLVATSSNHAEIIALHESVRECVWLRSIITHIRNSPQMYLRAFMRACIEQMKQGRQHNTAEILLQSATTDTPQDSSEWSEDNVADLVNKSLAFEKHVKSIGLIKLSDLPGGACTCQLLNLRARGCHNVNWESR